MIAIAKILKSIDLSEEKQLKKYGFGLIIDPNISSFNVPLILQQISSILNPVPIQLIKDCGIKTLQIRDLGPCKQVYPNHGYYSCIGNLIALNSQIFIDPDQPKDFCGEKGCITRAAETLYHELGHGYDSIHGDLSFKPEWLKISGWSKEYKPGLKRLLIKETGTKPIVGEWFFDPKAEFVRFYAKKCPEDDWADSFGYYVAQLIKDKIPAPKITYFDALLNKYYSDLID